MKGSRLVALAWLAGAGSCTAAVTAPTSERYAGYFSRGFEVESFRPCGEAERWWVTEDAGLRTRYASVARAPYDEVYVEVRGTVGPAGKFGHMGVYARELSVDEVLAVGDASRQADCK